MIGIDIVEIKRFEKFLEKKTALQKYLSDEEILLVTSPQTAAGFYASKEAISKALGTGIGKTCSFKDIMIHKDASGAPYFTLSQHIIDSLSITQSALSISHDGGFAIAVAVISYKKEHSNPLSH
jgi:holo-[acyl-carrier protein] synthase